jgi:hypothetical protein
MPASANVCDGFGAAAQHDAVHATCAAVGGDVGTGTKAAMDAAGAKRHQRRWIGVVPCVEKCCESPGALQAVLVTGAHGLHHRAAERGIGEQ